MTKTRRVIFGIVLLAMENILLLLIIIGTVWYLAVTVENRKSEFELFIEKQGLGQLDYKARAPYVMFRPRVTQVVANYMLRPGTTKYPEFSTYKDFLGFCEKLSREGSSNEASPSRRAWELLPAKGREAVKEAAESKDDANTTQLAVSGYVNHIIENPDFYSESDFKGIELCEDAIKLLSMPRKELLDHEIARLNRHLLTAAYPRTLHRGHVVNSLGFLSPELPIKKRPDEFRVAMIGGSVVFCARRCDISAVGRLAQAMEKRIPALKDKRITYINAGLPSGVSGQELAQLIYHVLPLDIDLLVVYDGFNDFYCPLNGYDLRPNYPPDYVVEEYRFYKYLGERSWSSTFLSLLDPTFMQAKPEKIVEDYYQALQIRKPTLDEIQPKLVNHYMSNVRKMAKIANAYGIKTIVFLQPYSPKHNPIERAECRRLRQLYVQAGEQYKVEARNNTPDRVFHDLSYTSKELHDLFVDVAHYWPPGNTIVARHMVDVMLKEGMFAE